MWWKERAYKSRDPGSRWSQSPVLVMQGFAPSWNAVFSVMAEETCIARTSHAQPLPWIVAALALKVFLNSSTPPNLLSMACFKGPSSSSPPPDPLGARFVQNKEWLMCPVDEMRKNIELGV